MIFEGGSSLKTLHLHAVPAHIQQPLLLFLEIADAFRLIRTEVTVGLLIFGRGILGLERFSHDGDISEIEKAKPGQDNQDDEDIFHNGNSIK